MISSQINSENKDEMGLQCRNNNAYQLTSHLVGIDGGKYLLLLLQQEQEDLIWK